MSDGRLSTHTASLAGTILTEFSAAVQFNFIGINYVIAHLRVGRRQIAIEKQVRVKAKLGECLCVLLSIAAWKHALSVHF